MQFSIARLLLMTLFVSFVFAATFAFPPAVGVTLLSFIAMFVVSPFIIVGAVNTRGLRQSFFLGAMISGTGHYIVNIYIVFMLTVSLANGDSIASVLDFSENWIRYLNGVGFLFGSIGGLSGMATFYLLKLGEKSEVPQTTVNWELNEESLRPDIYPESNALLQGKETALPR